jgi:hypothetical protein
MEKRTDRRNLTFYIDEMMQMRFYLQLKYDSLKFWDFLRMVIESYVDRDPTLVAYVNKALESKRSHRRKKMTKKDEKESAACQNDFALNQEEIENIFSIIETENPDL